MAQHRKPRKRVVTTEELIDDSVENLPEIEEPDPESQEAEDIFSSYGSGGLQIKVNRITPKGRQYCFIGYSKDDVSEEAIRNHPFGGPGDYFNQIYVHGRLDRSYGVSIAAPQNGNGATGGPGNEITRILLDELKTLKEYVFRKNDGPGTDVAALGSFMVQMMQTVQNQQPPFQSMLDMFKMGMETANRGGEEKGLLQEILSPIAQAAVPYVMGRMNGGPPPPDAPVPIAAPAPDPGGPRPVNQQAIIAKLKQGVLFLKSQCLSGTDPLLWSDTVGALARQSPESEYAALVHIIHDPAFSLSAFAAQVGDAEIDKPPYQSYFNEFANGLRSGFSAENTVDDNSERSNGNTGNPKSDGTTGKGSGKR